MVLRGNESTRLFDAHPLVEGFNVEHGTKLRVVPSGVADAALRSPKIWNNQYFEFVTNVAIAFETRGVKLWKEIVFCSGEGERAVLLSTGMYKGEKDIALVAMGLSSVDFHKDGDYTLLDIPENRLVAVPNFPFAVNGNYNLDPKTGIPHGIDVGERSDSRFLSKNTERPYVGLLTMGASDVCFPYYHASYGRDNLLAVVAEVPEEDVKKIEILLNLTPSNPRQVAWLVN